MHCSLFNSPALLRWSHTLWWLKLILFYWEQEVMVRNISRVSVHRRYSYGVEASSCPGNEGPDAAMEAGLRQLYSQLVSQNSFWYVAIGGEVDTGASGCKKSEHKAGVECFAVKPSWQPCSWARGPNGSSSISILPAPFLPSKSCWWNGLLMSGHMNQLFDLDLGDSAPLPPPRWMFNLRGILPQWPDLRQR